MAGRTGLPLPPEEAAKHVTIWNRHECRKIAGNAAPLRRNLDKYLAKHPECEEYDGQDKDPRRAGNAGSIDPVTGETVGPQNEHVPIWHTVERRKVTGNAAPLKKNLAKYLGNHPDCEVYKGQDKRTGFAGVVVPGVPGVNPAAAAAHAKEQAAVHVAAAGQRWTPVTSSAQGRWPPPGASGVQNHPATFHHNHNHPHPAGTADMSYSDMVSSWSNNPDWNAMYVTAGPGNYGIPIPNVGASHAGALFGTPGGGSFGHHMGDGTDNVNGIPIPGGVPRDRPDIVMGASMGASLGGLNHTPGDLVSFLGATPRSMDHDVDVMQFSPSNYLAMGASPQMRFPHHHFPHGMAAPTSLPRK